MPSERTVWGAGEPSVPEATCRTCCPPGSAPGSTVSRALVSEWRWGPAGRLPELPTARAVVRVGLGSLSPPLSSPASRGVRCPGAECAGSPAGEQELQLTGSACFSPLRLSFPHAERQWRVPRGLRRRGCACWCVSWALGPVSEEGEAPATWQRLNAAQSRCPHPTTHTRGGYF